MGISFEHTVYTGRRQAFWRGEAKMLPGGFHIANTINIGTVIKRGAFVSVDFSNMSANIVKVGKVVAGGTTSKPRVAKDNYFEVGDKLMKVGGAGATISAIDRTNSEYDVITLSTAITGLAADDFVQEGVSETTGESGSQVTTWSAKAVANAVLGADKEIKKNGSMTVDVAYEVLVIKDNVPAFPSAWIAENGFHLSTNPNIRFINQ